LTNQVSSAAQARRLGRLARAATIGVCVDSERQVSLLDDAAKDAGVSMRVYIELDVGGARCGMTAASDVVSLARAIGCCDGLKFGGLQAYNGKAQHIRDWSSRDAVVRESARQTQAVVAALNTAGFDCESVTGGGSGSFEADVEVGILSEVQCGTYALMDADYMLVHRKDGSFLDSLFSSALFVLSSIISDRHADYVVADAGLKAMAFDSGMPLVAADANLVYRNPSDEHGIITSRKDAPLPRCGDRIALVPGHCDPTMAMHDRIHVTVEGTVEAVWPTVSGGSW
jgi:3-hydroxy-D-aspartate aldolase